MSSHDNKKDNNKDDEAVVIVKGVRLKRFEQALVKLLPFVQPRYVPLPALNTSCLSSCPNGHVPTESTTAAKRLRQYATNGSITASSTTPPSMSSWDPYWSALPPAARVFGTLPGQLAQPDRAQRKEDQVKSMMQCILALLPTATTTTITTTIVDFGGGSGHLSLPLALLLPHCRIICVDLKAKSLEFLHVKAQQCSTPDVSVAITDSQNGLSDSGDGHRQRWKATALPNLWTYLGDVDSFVSGAQRDNNNNNNNNNNNHPQCSFDHSFHIGAALHVCGQATDVVLRACALQGAHMVVAPCCVGKLNRSKRDPYIYRATAQNCHTIEYPQSRLFQQCLSVNPWLGSNTTSTEPKTTMTSMNNDNDNNPRAHVIDNNNTAAMVADDWDALAKAADYNHDIVISDGTTNRRNAARRTAKCLIECDRVLFLQENYALAYTSCLTRMQPLTATPKHDILVAAYYNNPRPQVDNTGNVESRGFLSLCSGGWQHVQPSALSSTKQSLQAIMVGEEDTVVQWTREHLLGPSAQEQSQQQAQQQHATTSQQPMDSNDWTWQEEQEIRQQILQRFPPIRNAQDQIEPACSLKADENTDNNKGAHPSFSDTMIFPTGMGRRKRKLIHCVADQLGLAHRSVGKKWGDKTVAIQRTPNQQNLPTTI